MNAPTAPELLRELDRMAGVGLIARPGYTLGEVEIDGTLFRVEYLWEPGFRGEPDEPALPGAAYLCKVLINGRMLDVDGLLCPAAVEAAEELLSEREEAQA